MDFLHTQLRHVENQLSFVKTEPIDWKLYVQVFAWTVTFFESYLLYALPRLYCTLTQSKISRASLQNPPVSTVFQDRATSSARRTL